MNIKINYSKKVENSSAYNLILFTNDKFSTKEFKKNLSDTEFSYINDILKTSDLKKNLLVFEVSSKKKIILVSIKTNRKVSDIENLGAEL